MTSPLPNITDILKDLGGITQEAMEEMVTLHKTTFKSPVLKRSPRKGTELKISGKENLQSNMVKLLEAYELTVHINGLRKALSAGKKSQKPGYTLCYKLLPEGFSLEILAYSGEEGMTSVKEGDLRPCLDKTKVCAIKDYFVVWCKKNGHQTPLEPSSNVAITERISYARKQIKMSLKKHLK